MKFNPQTTLLMCALQDALQTNDPDNLLPIIEQIGLQGILDPELFKASRYFDRRPLIKFLATLGMENTDERAYYQRWLSATQWLDGQVDLAEAVHVCAAGRPQMVDFYGQILKAASKPTDAVAVTNWVGLPCLVQDMQFATELLLDHMAPQLLPMVLKRWRQIDPSGEPWLWICRTVAERVEYAKSIQKAETLANAFELLFEEVAAEHQVLVSSLMPHLVDLHLRSEHTDRALQLAESFHLSDPGLSSDYWLMMCHAKRSDFAQAVSHAQAVLEATLRQVQEVGDAEITEGGEGAPAPEKNRFDVDRAGESLKTINRILRERGLQPFLMSGVLLGYQREGQLLAHDKDIDIGLIGWQQQYEVVQALLDAGHYHIAWRYVRGEQTYLFDAHDLINDITIDFFFFHPHTDHFLHGIDYKYGFTQNLRFSPFGLKEVDFLGEKFFIPDNAEQNLSENYGDWLTPQSSYVVTVESPALVEKCSLKHQFITVIELLRCVNKFKSVKRAQRILDCCEELHMQPLSAELKARLYEWMAWQTLH